MLIIIVFELFSSFVGTHRATKKGEFVLLSLIIIVLSVFSLGISDLVVAQCQSQRKPILSSG